MKQALALCLFATTFVLGAPAAHAKPRASHKKTSALSAAKAADALEVPRAAAAEGSKRLKESFWLAADPHVPLATVDGKAIRTVGKRGKECGAEDRWAKAKSRWRAIDAWGRATGVYEVKASEAFDVTSCRELSMAAVAGKPGVGLFVSDDSNYTPGEAMSYSPTAGEKKRFEHWMNGMESSFVNQKPLGMAMPLAKRALFFTFAPPKNANWEGRVDGSGKPLERPKRWAVAGGPILVVAYLGEKGHWKAATVKAPLGLADSYVPVAVFDMNGDGVPEIVIRSSDGPNFANTVLSLNPETMTWEDAAASPGGSML